MNNDADAGLGERVPQEKRERYEDLIALLIFVENASALSPGPPSTGNPMKAEIVAELNAIGDMYPSLDPYIEENPIERALEVLREEEDETPHLDAVPEGSWMRLAEKVEDLYDGGPYWIVDKEEYES